MTVDVQKVRGAGPAGGGAHPRGAGGRGRRRRPLAAVLLNGWLWLVALLLVFPLYWALSTSFLPREEILSTAQRLWPDSFTLENYRELFTGTRFGRAMVNSLIISAVVTVVGTYVAGLAGFAFGKLTFRGRQVLFGVLLATLMIPPLVTVPINFLLMSRLGLLDTLWAVILPQLTPAFGIFWMRQYVDAAVPDEVLEAARIDGASDVALFHRIVLPLLRPGLAGLAIYLFLQSWNQFLLPLTYLQSPRNQTYPVFINLLNSSYAENLDHLVIAASVLSMVPIGILFLLGQRHFVNGITAGAVKG